MSATKVIHSSLQACARKLVALWAMSFREITCRRFAVVTSVLCLLSFSGRGMVGMVGVVVGMLLTLREGISAADAPLRRPRAGERRGAVRGVAGAEEGLLHAMLR